MLIQEQEIQNIQKAIDYLGSCIDGLDNCINDIAILGAYDGRESRLQKLKTSQEELINQRNFLIKEKEKCIHNWQGN